MIDKGKKKSVRQVLTDQRADMVPPGAEVRKGVNVLNTSDPTNPVVNPFVQAQNGAASQSQQAGSNAKGPGSESK